MDNRRYDDIIAEVRTRIPRYTPEWTDFNDSDPGMALVQLFAWLTDLLMVGALTTLILIVTATWETVSWGRSRRAAAAA